MNAASRPADSAPRLAVIGDFNIDVILGEVNALPRVGYDTVSDQYNIEPGGSAAIVAFGLGQAGWATDLYANVGDDLFGHWLRDTAKSTGVRLMNCADDRSESTGLSVAFSKHNDRGFISVPNPISDWEALDIILDEPPTHVHVCYHPYLPGLTRKLAHIFAELRARGTTLSMDPAGPGPDATTPLEHLEAVGRVDFLFLNDQEAGDLSIQLPPDQELFERLADTIIVKRGSQGAVAFTRDADYDLPERTVDVLETTGAGDNFSVGFLTSWLRIGDLETAVRAGNVFGSESTRFTGGVQVQHHYPDLMATHPELFEHPTP
ncbi:MAG: carbohydrate kinase family protein [Bacteroidota bacterium]|nr:carbohydrate kinase family protein [Bacteroidota bacterium]